MAGHTIGESGVSIDELSCTHIDEVPAQSQRWVTYDGSITEAGTRVTLTQVQVTHLVQETKPAPTWLPVTYQQDGLTFVREIELVAGPSRILIANSFTHPNGDIKECLEDLGQMPLANLLYQAGSTQLDKPNYVSSKGWYGRLVAWQIENCTSPLLLLELFDPTFTQIYPSPA